MAYHSAYRGLNQKGRSHGGTHVWTWVAIVIFAILFIIAVFWFRSSKKVKPQAGFDSTASVLTPVSVAPEVVNGAVNLESSNATLIGLSSRKPVGTAVRSMQANAFHIAMNATLPNIDRDKQLYAAWLVRQVPYAYIPVGSFTTNDLGSFVLDWNGETGKDFQAYTHVVITLQTKDGDPGPQGHVVEGDFGK